METLVRNREKGMLTGLCAAVANQLNIDPIIVRMVVVFVTIASGLLPGIVTYLFGWVFTPTVDQVAPVRRLSSWFRPVPVERVERGRKVAE